MTDESHCGVFLEERCAIEGFYFSIVHKVYLLSRVSVVSRSSRSSWARPGDRTPSSSSLTLGKRRFRFNGLCAGKTIFCLCVEKGEFRETILLWFRRLLQNYLGSPRRYKYFARCYTVKPYNNGFQGTNRCYLFNTGNQKKWLAETKIWHLILAGCHNSRVWYSEV